MSRNESKIKKIVNPETGRQIRVGGATYQKLIQKVLPKRIAGARKKKSVRAKTIPPRKGRMMQYETADHFNQRMKAASARGKRQGRPSAAMAKVGSKAFYHGSNHVCIMRSDGKHMWKKI